MVNLRSLLLNSNAFYSISTAWKVSKYGVISGPYFPGFGLNTEIYSVNLRIYSEYRKIWIRNNSAFGHFSRSISCKLLIFSHVLDLVYEYGMATLESVSGVQAAYCKYILLTPGMFYKDMKIQVHLSVQWNTMHPIAVWSYNVSSYGFKACVFSTGRYFPENINGPMISWMAFSARNSTRFMSGMVAMKTWYSGVMCEDIRVQVS